MKPHSILQPGTRIGERRVVALMGSDSRGMLYLMRCGCGREQTVPRKNLHGTTACQRCARQRNGRSASKAPRQRSDVETVLAEAGRAWPQLWRGWDDEAMAACAELALSGPLALHEIGALLGLSHEGVRSIEVAALKKLRARMELVGLSAADVSERVTLWDEIEAIDRMEAA